MADRPRQERSVPPDDAPEGTARVAASIAIRVRPGIVCRALAEPGWLGGLVEGPSDRPGVQRIETDLAFALPSEARVLSFRKAAYVDVGPVDEDGDVCTAEVGWRASTLAPLFPVFAGQVVAHDGTMRLDGVYAPPGGGIGVLVDRALLHFVAKRTAMWFLERVAEQASVASSGEPDR